MTASSPVMFVTRKWPPAVGGMETWSLRMSEELARLGPLEVVALPGRKDGSPPSAARLMAFPFTVVRRLLGRAQRPATIHLGDMALWPLGLLASARQRVVISAHGTDVSYHRRGGVRGKLYGAYLRLGARLMRRATLIANSTATARVAAETGWQATAVVPLGTDLGSDPRADVAGPDGTILFAGRLVARKGCAWFVREVLPLLSSPIRLRIAGTLWDDAEAWVVDEPRVQFLGALGQEQLEDTFARATCVVVPNIEPTNGEFEGFGLVACEAAAVGGVVLASRTGGLVDAVRDGETGMLLPAGDAQAWAAAIESVFAWSPQQRERFVATATERARTYYAWPRVARETAVHYGCAA